MQTRDLSQIKAVVMDVDGIMTDARIWRTADGEWSRAFTVKDGIGVKALLKAGYKVGWITGSAGADIRERAELLGVEFLVEGSHDKREAFDKFLKQYKVSAHEVAYIGDDTPDVPLLKQAGFAATVPEAEPDALEVAHFITKRGGGFGAAREFCDHVVKHGHFARR